MEIVAFLMIPGILSLFRIYRDERVLNISLSQWILVPVVLIYSTLSIIIAKIILQIPNILYMNFGKVMIEGDLEAVSGLVHYCEKFLLFKLGNLNIYMLDYILACIFSYLLTYRIKLFHQFAKLSAIDNSWYESPDSNHMVTLKNDKVYIGMVVRNDYWSATDNQFVFINPIFSGKRIDGKLYITSMHLDHNNKPNNIAKNNNIAVSKKEILSTREFEFDYFLDFFITGSVTTKRRKINHLLVEQSIKMIQARFPNDEKEKIYKVMKKVLNERHTDVDKT